MSIITSKGTRTSGTARTASCTAQFNTEPGNSLFYIVTVALRTYRRLCSLTDTGEKIKYRVAFLAFVCIYWHYSSMSNDPLWTIPNLFAFFQYLFNNTGESVCGIRFWILQDEGRTTIA